MTAYSFDTSTILNSRRDNLPPKVFRTLWANIEAMIAEGSIRAVDVVRDELGKRDDEANRWARAQTDLFVPLTAPIQAATSRVLAGHPKLTGIGSGRNTADPFVIALATCISDGVVVTEERPKGNLGTPKIPDVCEALGVPWRNMIGFVSDQGWSF